MESKPSWLQDPSNALGISMDLDALRVRLQNMSDKELMAFGKQMRSLVYPLTYDVATAGPSCRRSRFNWAKREPSGVGARPHRNSSISTRFRE
jgi:hypothetical protein